MFAVLQFNPKLCIKCEAYPITKVAYAGFDPKALRLSSLLTQEASQSRSNRQLRKKWIDNIKDDYSDLNRSLHQASNLAMDTTHSRYIVRNTGCQRAETSSTSRKH